MHYEEIFRALNKHKIRYLVIGGVAVNLYGHMRATMDLDLLISLDPDNRAKFLDLMKELKFRSIKPDLARKLLLGEYPPRQIKVVTFFRDEFELIDVFIESPIDFEAAYKKRKLFRSGRLTISTIPYDLLISMKRETEQLRRGLKASTSSKLRWLEGTQRFIIAFTPRSTLRRALRMRGVNR